MHIRPNLTLTSIPRGEVADLTPKTASYSNSQPGSPHLSPKVNPSDLQVPNGESENAYMLISLQAPAPSYQDRIFEFPFPSTLEFLLLTMRFQFSRTANLFAVLGVLFGVQVKALQASYDFIIVGGAPLPSSSPFTIPPQKPSLKAHTTSTRLNTQEEPQEEQQDSPSHPA